MAEPGEQKGEQTMNDTITMTTKQYEELINSMARFLAIKHYVGAEDYLNPDILKRLVGLEVKEEPAE